MVTSLNDYKASRIKVRNNMWHEKKKNVLKRLSPVLSHSYNTAWIQRLEEFDWDLYFWKSQSTGIKCAMYDQHFEY